MKASVYWNYAIDFWAEYIHEISEYKFLPLDDWLKFKFRRMPQIGKRDRLVYGNILYVAARFHSSCQSLGDLSSEESLRVSLFLQRKNFEALQKYLVSDSYLYDDFRGFLNDFSSYEAKFKIEDDFILSGFPEEYKDYLLERKLISQWTDEDTNKFMLMQCLRPPLWVRYQGRSFLWGESRIPIQKSPHYQEGMIEVQDFASQGIGSKVKAKNGQKVWDSCAGAGGKSLQISQSMNNTGTIFASDIRSRALEELRVRAARNHADNIMCLPWNGEDLPLDKGSMDWVLADVPCTGSGTWRRNPDAKIRMFQTQSELQSIQSQLLKLSSLAVKNKGSLVYGTCSFFKWENEDVVNKFIEESPDFTLQSMEMLGCPYKNSDTMFVAVLKRDKV